MPFPSSCSYSNAPPMLFYNPFTHPKPKPGSGQLFCRLERFKQMVLHLRTNSLTRIRNR